MLPAGGAHRDPWRHGGGALGGLLRPGRRGAPGGRGPGRRPAGPTVNARITDSLSYQHLWGTAELRTVFSEEGRLQGWLTVLAALARAQAAHGFIPAEAAAAITAEATVGLDLDRVAEGTRVTGHS